MKKSLLLLTLLLLASLVLVACGGDEATPPPEEDPTEAPENTPEPEITEEPEVTEEARVPGEEESVSNDPVDEVPGLDRAFQVDFASGSPGALCEEAVPAPDPANRSFTQPEDVIQPDLDYHAAFCTSAGPIYIDLLEGLAPTTVNNFVFLAQNDYYNNTIFHRVIQDFMAQGGDPTGTGTGGPGYQFEDEFSWFLSFDGPGWLAMANAGPATNGSQFFITTAPAVHLDGRHTIFGAVLEGQDNVEDIIIRDPSQGGDATTLDTVLIITDPETVVAETTELSPADQSTILNSFATLQENLNSEDATFAYTEEPLDTAAVVATAPDALQDDYAAFLDQNNHEYRIQSNVDNVNCNLEDFDFMGLAYSLDVFATAPDARAALGDGFLDTLATEQGMSPADEGYYSMSTQACDTDAVQGRDYIRIGRYIATVEATTVVSEQFTVGNVLNQIVARVYETGLANVFRAEIP